MPASLVDTTNFPLYTVNVLDEDHFLVAGGGGASKTGVPNAIVSIYHFLYSWLTVFNETHVRCR